MQKKPALENSASLSRKERRHLKKMEPQNAVAAAEEPRRTPTDVSVPKRKRKDEAVDHPEDKTPKRSRAEREGDSFGRRLQERSHLAAHNKPGRAPHVPRRSAAAEQDSSEDHDLSAFIRELEAPQQTVNYFAALCEERSKEKKS